MSATEERVDDSTTERERYLESLYDEIASESTFTRYYGLSIPFKMKDVYDLFNYATVHKASGKHPIYNITTMPTDVAYGCVIALVLSVYSMYLSLSPVMLTYIGLSLLQFLPNGGMNGSLYKLSQAAIVKGAILHHLIIPMFGLITTDKDLQVMCVLFFYIYTIASTFTHVMGYVIRFTVLCEPLCMDFEHLSLLEIMPDNLFQKLYREVKAADWTDTEIDVTKDQVDWSKSAKLTPNVKHMIEHIHAFFAVSDLVIIEAIASMAFKLIRNPYARSVLSFNQSMENTHSLTYSKIISVIAPNADAKKKLLSNTRNNPTISRKIKQIEKIMDGLFAGREYDIATLAVVMICAEGIGFSTSFQILDWLAKLNVMPGLLMGNKKIRIDEGLHAKTWLMIYQHAANKPPLRLVHKIFYAFAMLEVDFIEDGMQRKNIDGLNLDNVREYALYIGDYWLMRMELPILFGAENKLSWSSDSAMASVTNFFEKRNTDYVVGTSSKSVDGFDESGNKIKIEPSAVSLDADITTGSTRLTRSLHKRMIEQRVKKN